MADTMTKLQEISFDIIANAGEAKSYAYEALAAAKQKNADLYEEKMAEAEQAINKAHKSQFELLQEEAKGDLDDAKFSILVVHAQDHLMTVLTVIDMIKEIAEIHLKG